MELVDYKMACLDDLAIERANIASVYHFMQK